MNEVALRHGRLSGLDALRGIAALCVLAHHVGILSGGGFASRAYLAVDFFFMLSGYVMARTYEPIDAPRRFLLARLRRLWPLVALGMIMGVPAFVLANGAGALAPILAMGLLLVPALPYGAVYPLNPAAWSIAFELGANASHAFSLARWRTGQLAALAGGLFLLAAAISLSAGAFDLGHQPGSLLAGIPRCGFSYVTGICLYRTWRDRPPIRLPAPVIWAAMPIMLLIDFPGGLAFDLAFVAVGAPLLLAGGLANEAAFGGSLGRLSFPLYATHLPILLVASPLYLPLTVAAALAVAALLACQPWARWKPGSVVSARTSREPT